MRRSRRPTRRLALAEGRFSYRHAQVLIDQTGDLDDDDRAAVERVALGRAGTTTVARFTRQVRRLRERRDPSTMVDRAREAFGRREVTLDPANDGMAHLMISANAVDAAAIFDRATAAAGRALADGDPRTLAQLRVDVIVDALLDRDLTLGLGRSQLEAMAASPIDASTARRLTAQAPSLHRLLTDPETGVPLSLSRTTYRVPDSLRRWLRIRDGSCRFPMCSVSPRRCDLDHTLDWAAHDGPTDHDNLAHLSRGHHTLKHHGGWRVRQTAGGRLTWSSYLGREYTTVADAA